MPQLVASLSDFSIFGQYPMHGAHGAEALAFV
jgi:hypothetical protein